jgi:hypothetical protein
MLVLYEKSTVLLLFLCRKHMAESVGVAGMRKEF